jgi:hypothetical protein
MIRKMLLWVSAKVLRVAHSSGLSKNERIVVGGYKYPVAEFMGYSDAKIISILASAGAAPEQIQLTFDWLETLGRVPNEST